MADTDRSLESVDSLTTERAGNAYEFPTSATVAGSSGDNDPSSNSGGQNFRESSQSWDAKGNASPSGELRAIAKNKLSDVQDAVTRRYRFAADTTDDFVHENPWKAITMAALAGLVVGMLASR
ncbi:DUF883 domain-containing protein [Caballeronia novacaledonica]|uniref:DUF883 domain-containing protein n=1 Tax=Caballeronia novacaledonica TaxID=1544861 RepID=A0ACB5QQV4_9BURK|nr:DUF883 domain-containing protein [Caballeronia novacaledonica]